MRAKKYLWSILCVYFCYLTHGIQAIILSQNNVNFAKQWGFNMADPQSAAYAAGLAAVSTAVAWTGFGKFVSVWIGGEISDHVGRKKLMIGGAALYILCFLGFLFTKSALVASVCGFVSGVVSLKRLLNQSILKSWSSKMIKKSLEAYFFTLKNKIVFCKKQFQNMSVFCFVSTEIV